MLCGYHHPTAQHQPLHSSNRETHRNLLQSCCSPGMGYLWYTRIHCQSSHLAPAPDLVGAPDLVFGTCQCSSVYFAMAPQGDGATISCTALKASICMQSTSRCMLADQFVPYSMTLYGSTCRNSVGHTLAASCF